MGMFSWMKKKRFLVTLAVFAGLSFYQLHIGKQAEHMTAGVVESGRLTPVTGFVVTVKSPLDQKGRAIPLTPGGKIPVYESPAVAEKVAAMIKERLPGGIKKDDIAVEDLTSYQEDSDFVHQELMELIKKQIEATFSAKRFVKGPMSESLMLKLNRKACEMVEIQTQTWNFRDQRILSWMRELLETSSTKNNLDLDYVKKTVNDAKF